MEAQRLLSILTSALTADAPFDMEGEAVDGNMAKGALLTKMIRGLGGTAKPTDVEVTAKMGMYRDSIGDIPAWAIDLAIKRWAQGRCPYTVEEKPNYNFPPSPATLRRMAEFDMDDAKRDVAKLKALLSVIPMERALDPTPLPRTGLSTIQRM